MTGSAFDAVADEYDEGRPGYPSALFDQIEELLDRPLDGALVLDGGAGTGIASRALSARGARVVAFDTSEPMLRRAVARDASMHAAVADGAVLPFRSGVADLVCYAQAWHWLDVSRAAAETARVLRPTGRWAGWWSHARADGEAWFDAYEDLLDATCPAHSRAHRDIDWSLGLAGTGCFDSFEHRRVPWTRETSIDAWLTDERSKSYVAALDEAARTDLLAQLRQLLSDEFGDRVRVRYETWLWTATPKAHSAQ